MSTKVYVWDPLLRIFHWTLVLAFTFSYISGEEDTIWHIYSGYTILGLLVFRLIWGIIRGQYARFSAFSLAPRAVFAYLGGLFSKKESENYLGHNPAGSWMVIFLLLSLSLTVFSGLKHYGEEGHGPLAVQGRLMPAQLASIAEDVNSEVHEMAGAGPETATDGHARRIEVLAHGEEDGDELGHGDEDEVWKEVHEFFANLTLALVLLHLGGVILSSRKHKENLARAMVTGYKER